MTHPSRRDALLAAGLLTATLAVPGTASAAFASPAARDDDPWREVPRILRRIRPPRFPERRLDIRAYGAVGDGTTDCTDAFDRAIKACSAAGGGHVMVPPGHYLTGPIHLLSHVDLHVGEGATILFKTDPAAYLPVVATRWEGTECFNYSPFVYAYGRTNVAVTGRGTLDGRASQGPWESWYRSGGGQSADQQALRRMGAEGVPVEQRVFGAGHYLRPNMIQFYRCRNVLVSDVTVVDPAMWTIHPVLSRNVTVRDVTVHSTLYNTDGCDPECCEAVRVTGCRFDTNDDCVAVKSGRDEDGRRVGVPSRDIVVDDCLFSGRWGGLTVGSEMSGGVRNVFAERCVINSPDFPGHYPVKYPLYIKANKRRGGVVDGVHLRRFTGGNVERDAVFVNMNYNGETGAQPVTVQNITVERTTLDGAARVLDLVGLPTDHLARVHLYKCEFTQVKDPVDIVRFVDDLRLEKVTVNGSVRGS
jgi:polygalacturonase